MTTAKQVFSRLTWTLACDRFKRKRIDSERNPHMTPILWNHDHNHPPVGFIRTGDDGKLHFHFTRDVRMTDMWFREVFGSGIGYRIDESEMVDGVRVIKSGTILEYSL